MKIKFEAGSYNYDGKAIRSIARYKEMGSGWEMEMVLVNISKKYDKPEEAAMLAKMDIDIAKQKALDNRGTITIDHHLVAVGYSRLDEKTEERI
jgi:hypothetical protein